MRVAVPDFWAQSSYIENFYKNFLILPLSVIKICFLYFFNFISKVEIFPTFNTESSKNCFSIFPFAKILPKSQSISLSLPFYVPAPKIFQNFLRIN